MVRRTQTRPAVGARDELVRQPEFELGMDPQVRDASYAERLGVRLAHAEHIGVVEAEPRRNPYALLGKQRLEARIGGRRTLAPAPEPARSRVITPRATPD